MNVEKITADLYSKLQTNGIKGRIVSTRHLSELQKDIEKRYKGGALCEEFYRERLTYFDFSVPESLPEAESIIMVAAPQPQIRVGFSRYGKSYHFLIPPTYSYDTDEQARNLLLSVLEPQGYNLVDTKLPVKLLAVHSGLARYGKNNITYIDGMGSFHRLKSFYTDLPCTEDKWIELQALEKCTNCSACVKICPGDAISRDRFLIHAEKCLTFHNERQNEFPEWIDPSSHNCLIGCLDCQLVCPLNKDFINRIENREEFSEEETNLILQGKPKDKLPVETVEKIQRLELLEDLELLSRNLKVLFNKYR